MSIQIPSNFKDSFRKRTISPFHHSAVSGLKKSGKPTFAFPLCQGLKKELVLVHDVLTQPTVQKRFFQYYRTYCFQSGPHFTVYDITITVFNEHIIHQSIGPRWVTLCFFTGYCWVLNTKNYLVVRAWVTKKTSNSSFMAFICCDFDKTFLRCVAHGEPWLPLKFSSEQQQVTMSND